ncbi:MAG: phage tail protein [Faecalibacterium prausnitzii]
MYEIYAYPYGNPDAKLLLYRPNDPQALVLSPKLTREVSKGGSLVFTMTRDHAQYDMLQKLSTVVQVRRDGKEIWRGRVLKHEADFYNRRVVYCEGALSYFNDSSITPFNYKGTLRQFLQHLIDAHNDQVKSKMKCFQLGTVTAALGNLVVQFGDADQYGVGEDYGKVWDILDKLVLKVFGGYFYCGFDAATGYNVLNYCDQAVEAKRQTAQKIEYGRNLLNLSETTDATDLYTRIYPIGNKHTVDTSKWYYKLMWWRDPSKDKHEERWGIMEADAATVAQYLPASGYSYNLEEGWIQNDTAVQKFGIITRIVELDTDSANDTFAAGVQALQQNYAMKTSYVIRAVDLVDAGYDTDRLDFSMYSHIISKPHSVDAVMLCTKLVEPLEKPAQKEFTFGMTRRTLTDRQVANMGTTNLLVESAYTSEKYHQDMLKRLFAASEQAKKDSDEAAKTATNFLEYTPQNGLIVRHDSLPGKQVQILNDGIRVMDGSSMVNIQANAISITDGMGSFALNAGTDIANLAGSMGSLGTIAEGAGGLIAKIGSLIIANPEVAAIVAIVAGVAALGAALFAKFGKSNGGQAVSHYESPFAGHDVYDSLTEFSTRAAMQHRYMEKTTGTDAQLGILQQIRDMLDEHLPDIGTGQLVMDGEKVADMLTPRLATNIDASMGVYTLRAERGV